MISRIDARVRRHKRVRARVIGRQERPRLSVSRSLTNIYAQIIDDTVGRTLVAASSLDAGVKEESKGKTKSQVAGMVGSALARKAIEKGLQKVVFDRGGFRYHGRIKALADAARSGGLVF